MPSLSDVCLLAQGEPDRQVALRRLSRLAIYEWSGNIGRWPGGASHRLENRVVGRSDALKSRQAGFRLTANHLTSNNCSTRIYPITHLHHPNLAKNLGLASTQVHLISDLGASSHTRIQDSGFRISSDKLNRKVISAIEQGFSRPQSVSPALFFFLTMTPRGN